MFFPLVCSDPDSLQPTDGFHPFFVQVMMVLPSRNGLVRLSRLVPSLRQFFSWLFFSQSSCCLMYEWMAQRPFLILFFDKFGRKIPYQLIFRKHYFIFSAKWPHFCHFLTKQTHWPCVHMLLWIKFNSMFFNIVRVIMLCSWNVFNFSPNMQFSHFSKVSLVLM